MAKRTRLENRANREKHIQRNKTILQNCTREEPDKSDGYYKNSHEVAAALTGGRSKKTNTRKGHGSYRSTQGAYGSANQYSPHDQKQLDHLHVAKDEDEI